MDWLVLGLLRCVGNLLSLGFAVEISGFHGKSLVFSRTPYDDTEILLAVFAALCVPVVVVGEI